MPRTETLESKLAKIPKEYAFVHTTNSLYLAGEYLYYSIYCFNEATRSLTNLSKVSYVELINEQGEQIFKHKVRLENGVGSADFFIPTSTPTGAYKLLGYTQWMQNGSLESIFQANITIINPYRINGSSNLATESIDSLISAEQEQPKVLSKDLAGRSLQLPINKLNYKQRELVSIDLKGLHPRLLGGQYSISVRRQNLLKAPLQPRIDRYLDTLKLNSYEFNLVNKNVPALPELRGELYYGRVRSNNSKLAIDNLNIAISIPGEIPFFSIVKSDNNGYFYFNIDRYYSGTEIIFDVIDADKKEYNFELIERSIDQSDGLNFHKVILDSSMKKALVARSVANQIENAYFKFKPDSTAVPKAFRFFDQYQRKTYFLDDFTRFKTIRETIFEYVKDVVIRRVNSSKSVMRIKGYNFGTNSLALPLVLLDGVVLQNHNALLEYESASIESIEVFRDQFVVGPQTYQGALIVRSKAGQEPSNFDRFNLNQPLQLFRSADSKSYFKQTYSDQQLKQRLPDYRYQLYWQAVKPFTDRDTKLQFYTSDITGSFEVLLQGVSKQGKPITAFQIFTVK